MKKSEMINLMEDTWREYTRNISKDFGGVRNGMDLVLQKLEEHMEPKCAGKHQSNSDIAMGSRCQWDLEDEN